MSAALTARAASDYLRLTLFAYDLGLISRTHFEARLDVLRAIADPQSAATLYAAELLGKDEQIEDAIYWEDGGESTGGSSRPLVTTGMYVDATDNTLSFKIVDGTLKGWEFHQADDDFFPSIPHGHEHGRKQPKLDVYLGWVYKHDQQLRRVDRASIVTLWNDDRFRQFASAAIGYYFEPTPVISGMEGPKSSDSAGETPRP